MATRIFSLLFDANDHRAVARWWAEALGRTLAFEDDGGAVVAPGPAPESLFVFLPVPEPKTVKNRLHLDLVSESDEHQRRLVDRLIGLGARALDIGQRDVPWVVLGDPEENEFCVLEPRPDHGYSGAVASIVIDAADPARMAAFWSEVTGWPVVRSERWGTVLRAASGDGPFLELVRNDEPKTTKNRVHIDAAPVEGAGQTAEVARLAGLGAHHVDIGQGDVPWVVLADPEGNEFCVLTPR